MHEAASFVMSARSLDEGLYVHSLPVTSLTFSASRSTSSLSYALLCTAVIKPLPDAEECFAGLLLNYINGSIIPAWAYQPLCIIKTVKRISRCFNVIDSRPDFMKLLVELVPLCIGERLADTWHQKGMKLAP